MKYLGPDFQYDAELSPAPNKVKLKAKTTIPSSYNITTESLIVTMDHGSEDPIPDISGQ